MSTGDVEELCVVVIDGVRCNRPTNPNLSRTLCTAHRGQYYEGKPFTVPKRRRPSRLSLEEVVAYYLLDTERQSNGCLFAKWKGRRGKGYPMVSWNGKANTFGRLILELHSGPPNGRQMLHSCHDPRCVEITHLRWGNMRENSKDMVLAGRARHAKVSYRQVEIIRYLVKRGVSQAILAQWHGLDPSAISHMVRHKTWNIGGQQNVDIAYH